MKDLILLKSFDEGMGVVKIIRLGRFPNGQVSHHEPYLTPSPLSSGTAAVGRLDIIIFVLSSTNDNNNN